MGGGGVYGSPALVLPGVLACVVVWCACLHACLHCFCFDWACMRSMAACLRVEPYELNFRITRVTYSGTLHTRYTHYTHTLHESHTVGFSASDLACVPPTFLLHQFTCHQMLKCMPHRMPMHGGFLVCPTIMVGMVMFVSYGTLLVLYCS